MTGDPDEDRGRRPAGDWVAIILAVGIAAALNIITIALLYAALSRLVAGATIGLSENGTQLLTGWGGGIIGVLGSFVGYQFGKHQKNGKPDEPPPLP